MTTWPPTSLNDTQLANARIISQVGQSLGASSRDIQIALMTAMQESELLNMKGGDRDSTGLFQQRDAWGAYADRMDPYKSAAMFFQGGQDGQRGLLDFKDRDNQTLTQAAQAVQGSAYPDAYAKWDTLAAKYMPQLGVTGAAEKAAVNETATGLSENTANTAATAVATATPVGLDGAPAGLTAMAPAGLDAAAPAGLGAGQTAAPTQVQPTQPAQPDPSGVMTPESFHATFPDAGATKMFSSMNTKLGMARRTDAVATGLSYLGVPYVWGGNSRSGLDCSGLVQQTYAAMGISLPRLSADQIRAGQSVPFAQLKPGDLIGWDENSRNNGADHIAIYAGAGRIIEAPRPGLAVRTRQLSEHEISTALTAHFGQLD